MTVGFAGLDDAVPADNAFIGDGAGQIRNVKAALNTVFPAVDAEITKPTDYGTAATQQPTSADFSLLFTDVNELQDAENYNSKLIPLGTIVMWSGNDWSTQKPIANARGWYECDGTPGNGRATPDLTGVFAKGWDGLADGGNVGTATAVGDVRTTSPYIPGTTTAKSVNKTYQLQETDIPEHSHVMFGGEYSVADGADLTGANDVVDVFGSSAEPKYRMSEANGTPHLYGKTSTYGNSTADDLDLGLTDAQFDHEHVVTVSDPSNVAVIFLMYCGVE